MITPQVRGDLVSINTDNRVNVYSPDDGINLIRAFISGRGEAIDFTHRLPVDPGAIH